MRSWLDVSALSAALLMTLVGLAANGQTRPTTDGAPSLGSDLYAQLRQSSVKAGQAVAISDISLEVGPARFDLRRGTLLPVGAGARIVGAVFIGDGSFGFSPPDGIEADQVEKFAGKRVLDERFSRLLLLFTDDTWTQLAAGSNPAGAETVDKAQRYLTDRFKHHLTKRGINLAAYLVEALIEGDEAFFIAEPDTPEFSELTFFVDPTDYEPIGVHDWSNKFDGILDVWCSFRPDNATAGPRALVSHYDIKVRLEGHELVEEIVRARIEPGTAGARVLRFRLHPLMEVVSVENAAGDELFAMREKSERDRWEPSLTVVLPQAANTGDELVFKLKGKMIEKIRGERGQFGILVASGWYPRLGYRERSTFDLEFDIDKKHTIYVSADKLSDEIEGDRRITRWRRAYRVASVSFNYGDMPVEELDVQGLPPVTVFGREAGFVTGNQLRNVGADVLNSMNFFQRIYGDYPFESLYATSIPYGHGQGFPGLIHLSRVTFGGERKGASEYFRAHEVAHQWWGHIIGWKSYRDQWLSEGFATYSGALYFLASTGDSKRFAQMLEGWRSLILWKDHVDAGPISLGRRLNSSQSGSYRALVYRKGAYVMHMLRMLVHDYSTGSGAAFEAIMRAFVEKHRGTNVSTADFRASVEQSIGQDMGWFFDQWVDGVGIPKYTWAWRTDRKDGKHQLQIRVKQEVKGADPYQMIVPVKVEFGNDKWSVYRLPVKEAERTFTVSLQNEPKDLTFNFKDAVLATVRKERF